MKINPALIGKAGELLVAAELMRRGVEVAIPASDVGVDLLAYLLREQAVASKFVPIQVKASSTTGFAFFKSWFVKAPGLVLVHVWNVQTAPEFYVFDGMKPIEEALGPVHASSASWQQNGKYTITTPSPAACERMQAHRDKWDRIVGQFSA